MKPINYLILWITLTIFLTANNVIADSKCKDNLVGDITCNNEDSSSIQQTNYESGSRSWTVRKGKPWKGDTKDDKTENAFKNIKPAKSDKSSSCLTDILGNTICN